MNDLQQFYILHTRPFRETSLLIECLTEHEGCITLLAKGVLRGKSNLRAVLQPFQLLTATWKGRSDLKVLYNAELVSTGKRLEGKKIYSGLYINELLLRVLHKHAPCPKIFELYSKLMSSELDPKDLRVFEEASLEDLGYALQLDFDAETHSPILPEKFYRFTRELGVVEMPHSLVIEDKTTIFSGESLIAISNQAYTNDQVLQDAKRLIRLAFLPLLGDRPLKMREIMLTSLT